MATLGVRNNDAQASSRERLRVEFLGMRERAALLVAEIPQDLRDFTVHDITHLDALWEIAAIIAGGDYPLTPLEAFVLGGAFLFHDAGMSLAAYPQGRDALRREKQWGDAFVARFEQVRGCRPNAEDLRIPNREIEDLAIADLLRELHAAQGERLPMLAWRDRADDAEQFLISSVDLRQDVGPIIGRVAHSHWWPVEELPSRFPRIIGAPAGYPHEWGIDPLKVACLLRVADAGHIDARRAPRFLRALRKPEAISRSHWVFQERIHKPKLSDDRLEYTCGSSFALADAEAWWLCFDTIQMIDRELRGAEAVLGDHARPRFRARRVAGAEDPMQLSEWIPTAGWEAIDTRLRVTDVFGIIDRIGGRELYGDNATVPLRELIQNASDAVRARRVLDHLSPTWGKITVRLGTDPAGDWLEVEDNGIGMSRRVMTSTLLDFGTSYWNSALMRHESPGLLADGFQAVGRYGIGFFSVFMLGRRVRVTSRRPEDSRKETRVLDFNAGPWARPILRPANETEFLLDGGTRVRVWLRVPYDDDGGLARAHDPHSFEELCAWLCPALDVDLSVHVAGRDEVLAVRANDWVTMDGETLLERVRDNPGRRWLEMRADYPQAQNVASSLRTLRSDGRVVGRAAVHYEYASNLSRGVLCVGGLRACALHGISGIFAGYSTRAARDSALPLFDEPERVRWAEEQVPLVLTQFATTEARQHCASTIFMLGGRTGPLPIAESADGALSFEGVTQWASVHEEVIVFEREGRWVPFEALGKVKLLPNVLSVDQVSAPIINSHRAHSWPWGEGHPQYGSPLILAVLEAISKAWGASIDSLRIDPPPAGRGKGIIVARVGDEQTNARMPDAFTVTRRKELPHGST
jgi:hypothetical protein